MNASKDPALNLVSAAFGVAVYPNRFDDLLSSWDEWIAAYAAGENPAFGELSPAFTEALEIAEQLDTTQPDTPALDRMPAPTILLDAERQILAINHAATSFIKDEGYAPEKLLEGYTERPIGFEGSTQSLYRLGGGNSARTCLAIETDVPHHLQRSHTDARFMLLLSLMDWTDAFERELSEQLSLSTAELRVARGMLEGRTAQEIAGDLGRSLPTIRSHIKVLLEKSGARRQTEFVQFLTILRQVFDVSKSRGTSNAPTGEVTTKVINGPAGQLEITEYGAGQPLLYFTTSSTPWESAAVRAAFITQGYRVIAPSRPGFGQSTATKGDANDALFEHWIDSLLDYAGPNALVAGHREGGILAAKIAAAAVRKGHSIGGLLLISCGAPITDLEHLDTAPWIIRRSFLSAQSAKLALRLGYLTAARLFRSGPMGQKRIIEYFCGESEIDLELIKSPGIYATLRDNLEFCLAQPLQIVRDIALWGSDWSDDLNRVAATAPVHFVHGEKHHFLPIAKVEGLAANTPSITLESIEGAGQLALYTAPDRLNLATVFKG